MVARSLPLLAVLSVSLPGAPKAVTFSKNIAPIIYTNCSPCHRPGESGPFSLLSYEDVKRHASQIANVTKRRFMPPWLPEPGYGDFQEQRRLTEVRLAAPVLLLGRTGHEQAVIRVCNPPDRRRRTAALRC